MSPDRENQGEVLMKDAKQGYGKWEEDHKET
jgi:hypothetical protein